MDSKAFFKACPLTIRKLKTERKQLFFKLIVMTKKIDSFEIISDVSEDKLSQFGFKTEELEEFLPITNIVTELRSIFRETTNSKRLVILEKTNTTMTLAKDLLSTDDAQAGDVFIALSQKNGMGQQNRDWISPEGNLYMNTIIDIQNKDIFSILPLLIALAVNRVLREDYGIKSEVKWPNDIVIKNTNEVHAKICGILTQVNPKNKLANVGIGVNLNTLPQISFDKFVLGVTSLQKQTSEEILLGEFLNQLLERIDEVCLDIKFGKKEVLIQEYNESLAGRFKQVCIHNEQKGSFEKGVLFGVNDLTNQLKIGDKHYQSGRLEILHQN